MSILGQTVQNAGAALYADLSGSSFAPGTNILLFNLNVGQGGAGGTRNQNWRFIPVNSDLNQYKIQSVLTGLYASVGSAVAGQAVVSSLTAFTWQVTVVDTFSTHWIIRVPNTNLVWNVPAGSGPNTNVTIAATTSNNLNQQWTVANVKV
ncbi:hypothetical protein HD554DRAFT_2117692 [Boletus coccyginus]|nr:hypothetical protein HD554DRAFT_2117692 [Boletus coccyginus]